MTSVPAEPRSPLAAGLWGPRPWSFHGIIRFHGRARGRRREPLVLVTEAYVYLLRCRDGSLYTGWTVDLGSRLARHQAGLGSRYTASRLPVELALAIPMPDRSAARREEARIKGLPRAAKLALLRER